MEPVEIEGYHGTALENVSKILKGGFVAERRDDHWLGQGIYFYDKFDLALWWIKTKLRSTYGHNCGVLKAVISAQENEILDLDTVEGVDYFFSEVDTILRREATDISLKFSSEDRTKNLCFALDLLKKLRQKKVLLMTFTKDRPSYGKADIMGFEKQHFSLPYAMTYKERQICVSDEESIFSKSCVHPKNRTNWHQTGF